MQQGGPPTYAGMQPMGAPETYAQGVGMPGTSVMKERPYFVGLLLAIVTFGIYALYWHFVTHDELNRQVGRRNEEKNLWFGYIGVYVVMFILTIVLAVVLIAKIAGDASEDMTEKEQEEAIEDAFVTVIPFILVIGLLWVVGIVLFIMFVVKQYALVRDTRRRWGLPDKVGPGWFFGFYYGAAALAWIPFLGLIAIAAQPIAYYNLQEHYNELQRVASGRGPAVPAYGQPTTPYPMPGQAPYTGAYPPAQRPAAGQYYAPPSPAPQPSQPARPTWAGSGGYRIGDRTSTPQEPPRMVAQTFQCPRCHGHVTAQGAAGSTVPVRCAQCGEGGMVPLPP